MDDRGSRGLAGSFARLPTGIKFLSIISLFLAPLGLIALFASLNASRTADLQRRADLRVAVSESVRKLDTEIVSDVTALSTAVRALETGMPADLACTRLATLVAAHTQGESDFALFGIGATPVCASPGFRPARPSTDPFSEAKPQAQIVDGVLAVSVPGRSGSVVGVTRYSADTLGLFARPSAFSRPYGLALAGAGGVLELTTRNSAFLIGSETHTAATGLFGMTLTMTVDRVPFGWTEALLTFLPLLMWASAAVIGFLLTDRLLIRPLKALRAAVASHQPGVPFRPPHARTPALEIRDLGQTFASYDDALATRQNELSHALERQTKLTREVHHRVKNNLQVVASLISLHARGNRDEAVARAYASIQRRVDALSIVHRNHYAEMEGATGIGVKTLIGELAANLRASMPGPAPVPAITVSVAALQVTQDNAVALAFLLTELAELSFEIAPSADIAVSVTKLPQEDRARLEVCSAALVGGDAFERVMEDRHARVIQGLSRQLRTSIDHDTDRGCFSIQFSHVS